MATLTAQSQLTLLELAKRTDPTGNLAVIAEVLARDNEILQDAPWLEANDVFSHKVTQRFKLPTGSWRKLNAGVANEASATREVRETLGMLETYSEVDKDLADAAPNPKQFRSQEAAAFLEGLSQTLASTIIYGNAAVDTEKFTGLAPRMDALATNVLGCSGTGADLSSLYIVQWGETRVHLVYPRGSKNLGVKHTDLGEVTLEDASGYNFQGYRDHFQVKCGLVVRDERCIARVCNIETSGTSNILDDDKIVQVLNKMPMRGSGAVIYANATILSQLDVLAKDKTNVQYGPADAFGRPVMYFRGIPVRKVDAILDTESALT
jgi:hypothetical protein